jgi:hypothetical protein
MISYNHHRQFPPVRNTANGETLAGTIFHYKQVGNVLSSSYSGGRIRMGHLIGLVDEKWGHRHALSPSERQGRIDDRDLLFCSGGDAERKDPFA